MVLKEEENEGEREKERDESDGRKGEVREEREGGRGEGEERGTKAVRSPPPPPPSFSFFSPLPPVLLPFFVAHSHHSTTHSGEAPPSAPSSAGSVFFSICGNATGRGHSFIHPLICVATAFAHSLSFAASFRVFCASPVAIVENW